MELKKCTDGIKKVIDHTNTFYETGILNMKECIGQRITRICANHSKKYNSRNSLTAKDKIYRFVFNQGE